MKLQRQHFSPQLFKDPECWSGRSLELTTSRVSAQCTTKWATGVRYRFYKILQHKLQQYTLYLKILTELERGNKALLLSCIALNYLWLLTYSSPEATICCLFAETRTEVEAMGISKSCISSILLRIPNNQRKYASSKRGQLSSPDNKMRFLMLHFLPLTFWAYD